MFSESEKKQYRRLWMVFLIGVVFALVGLVGASIARSDVLRAAALHLVMDVVALLVSLVAMRMAVRKANKHFTFGLRRAEPVAGFFNAVLVLVAALEITVESIQHLNGGEAPREGPMLIFALVAMVVNGISVWLIHGAMGHDHPGHDHAHGPERAHAHQKQVLAHAHGHEPHEHGFEHQHEAPRAKVPTHDCEAETVKDQEWQKNEKRAHQLNLRGAWLHLLGDTLGSLAAVVAAIVIRMGGPRIIDPLASLAVVVILVIGALRLLKDALWVLLEAAPKHIPLDEVEKRLRSVASVVDVSNLHVWTVGGHHDAITVHVQASAPKINLAEELAALLKREFDATYVTVQVENISSFHATA